MVLHLPARPHVSLNRLLYLTCCWTVQWLGLLMLCSILCLPYVLVFVMEIWNRLATEFAILYKCIGNGVRTGTVTTGTGWGWGQKLSPCSSLVSTMCMCLSLDHNVCQPASQHHTRTSTPLCLLLSPVCRFGTADRSPCSIVALNGLKIERCQINVLMC